MAEISMAEYVTTVLLALINGLWIGHMFGRAYERVIQSRRLGQ
jgi:hypothetical protein